MHTHTHIYIYNMYIYIYTHTYAHTLKTYRGSLDIDHLDLIVSCPDDLSARIHARHGLLLAQFDHGRALVVTQSNPAYVRVNT